MIRTTPVFTGIPEGPITGVCGWAGVIRDGDSVIPTDGLITAIHTTLHTGDGILTDTMIPGTHLTTTEDITGTHPITGDRTGVDIIPGTITDSMTGTVLRAATCMAGWITGTTTGMQGHPMRGT